MHIRNHGFTLIELMLALSLAAVVMSLALPALHGLQQRHRIDAAANELVAHINAARHHAVMKREITVMCPSHDAKDCSGGNRWEHGWIVFRDPDRNRQPDGADDILRVGSAMRQLWIDSAGRTRIRYTPSGASPGTNLTIKLCDPADPGNSRAVVVSNPGRPRVGELPSRLNCPTGGT